MWRRRIGLIRDGSFPSCRSVVRAFFPQRVCSEDLEGKAKETNQSTSSSNEAFVYRGCEAGDHGRMKTPADSRTGLRGCGELLRACCELEACYVGAGLSRPNTGHPIFLAHVSAGQDADP